MMPLLYVYGCVAGLVGGMVVSAGMLDISPAAYLDRTLEALDWSHLGLGVAKSLVFGALVGMVGCYCGLYAQRNADGVGRRDDAARWWPASSASSCSTPCSRSAPTRWGSER